MLTGRAGLSELSHVRQSTVCNFCVFRICNVLLHQDRKPLQLYLTIVCLPSFGRFRVEEVFMAGSAKDSGTCDGP